MVIRVLHVLNSLSSGGAESFIMNVYRNIDKSKVQFDFLLRSNQNNLYIEEVERLGGKVYILPDFPRHILKNYKELKEFFTLHEEYKIMHVHANSLLYIKPLKVAMDNKVPVRIIHSHNTRSRNNLFYGALHAWNKRKINKIATHLFACSEDAGKWMFGENKFKVIHNAVDLENFTYNLQDRANIRKEFGIENKYVIGHVGRFAKQKNPIFLLEIFKAIKELNSDAVLLLVGTGEMEQAIKKKASQLGVMEDIIFAGVRTDIPQIMSAMDVFLFPSLYEGLAIALIEAQASGLNCVTSEKVVPSKVNVTGLVKYIPLDQSAAEWAASVLKSSGRSPQGKDMKKTLKNAGYDIKSEVSKMESFYIDSHRKAIGSRGKVANK